MAVSTSRTEYLVYIRNVERGTDAVYSFKNILQMRKFLSHFFDQDDNFEYLFKKREWKFNNTTRVFDAEVLTDITLPTIIWTKYQCVMYVSSTESETIYKRIRFDFDTKAQLKKFMHDYVNMWGTQYGYREFNLYEMQLQKVQNGLEWVAEAIEL